MYGEMLELIGADEWDGSDATITCPCGHTIEPDAPECSDGCVNPLREEGLI